MNELLRQKLVANAQRRERERYLESLPPDLKGYLSGCPFLQAPASDPIVPLFHVGEKWVGYGPAPADYRYFDFAWSHKLFARLAEVARFPSAHNDTDAYFWPSRNNPVYVVSFGWLHVRLGSLWNYSPMELGVIRQDRRAGILVSSYVGYLTGDHSPDKTVYELGIWGFS